LSNRIGDTQLYRLAPVESDLPERAVKRLAPLAPATGASWPPHWPRPPRLLDPPERIEAMALLPDHPPAAFTWRGRRRRVVNADGPERVFGEWWRADAERNAVRDYFQSRTRAANASGCFAQAMAKTLPPALIIGSCMASSHDKPLHRTAMRFAFLVPARRVSCDELFATAAAFGMEALAITDRNSLAGIVRAHEAAKTTGVPDRRLPPELTDSSEILVYPTDRAAYSRLCRLLSAGQEPRRQGACELSWDDLAQWSEGLIAILVPDRADDGLLRMQLIRLRDIFGANAYWR
jgi:hypothetical protein